MSYGSMPVVVVNSTVKTPKISLAEVHWGSAVRIDNEWFLFIDDNRLVPLQSKPFPFQYSKTVNVNKTEVDEVRGVRLEVLP